jgi:signal transduction histidine kinase
LPCPPRSSQASFAPASPQPPSPGSWSSSSGLRRRGLRDALARSLADPTLDLAFWLPERRAYVDESGQTVDLRTDDPRRAVTTLHGDGGPVAAIVHDPTLLDEPGLVQAAGAAARLALENARLQAELRAQLAKVEESRARIVAAGDEQRRRIERDLHDDAQQRLVALALELRIAQRRLGREADPEVERVLADATEERLPPEVEAAAYFIACEALANVVKHARATAATVTAQRRDGRLLIEVSDDGVGGASADGSGLRGLADRVEAHGGRLRVESSRGGGTRVIGEIPCAS